MNKIVFGRTSERVGVIGYGTYRLGGGWWRMDRSNDEAGLSALEAALESGATFIDTAEAYGAGHSEELVGEAVRRAVSKGVVAREDLFIATKVSEDHLRYDDVIRSCDASLRRLGVRQIDLYQVHWPNPAVPLQETMAALESLVDAGKIRYIGVSNFSVELFKQARENLSKYELQSDQVSYSVFDRRPEKELLGFCRKEGVELIAYSPLGAGSKWRELPVAVKDLSRKYGKTEAQIMLNWLVSKGPVIPIPKALSSQHILENSSAADFVLTEAEYASL